MEGLFGFDLWSLHYRKLHIVRWSFRYGGIRMEAKQAFDFQHSDHETGSSAEVLKTP